MDRRNFLAYIPSVSAIPLVGTNILQFDNKIEIVKPELIKNPGSTEGMNLLEAELQVVYKGKIVGQGYITELNISSQYMGPRSIEVSGQLFNLINY